MEIRSNMKKYTGTKVIILKTKTNIRAWHFCDICDYKDKCEYYRKVVVCPYLKIEKKIVIRKFYIGNVTPGTNTIFVFE